MAEFTREERIAYRKGAEAAEAKVRQEYDGQHLERIATALENIVLQLQEINRG